MSVIPPAQLNLGRTVMVAAFAVLASATYTVLSTKPINPVAGEPFSASWAVRRSARPAPAPC